MPFSFSAGLCKVATVSLVVDTIVPSQASELEKVLQ